MSARLILIFRTALYAAIIICSLVIFSALAVSMNKHENNCLLYAEVKKSYGSASTCNYSIAIAVIFCLLCPIAVVVLTVLTFIGIVKDKLMQFAELPFLIQVIADGVAFFFVLISACTISVGFKTLCDSIVGGTNIPCSKEAVIPGHDKSKNDFFYENLSAAEGGAWAAVILWLVQFIGGLFVLWRNGRLPCLPPSKDQPSTPPQQVPATF
ncbi:transmembrane protein 179B-like isoform X1 [Haliotis rubra]|uniref:transmembrane protein 179B-like isoform X1 n=1 Tax=Haliotis rubra TaxID=36100 RepID=UPI001EE5D92B|nr:transmembrane protein 179B-like isoform X1 [Haliotis rubra]